MYKVLVCHCKKSTNTYYIGRPSALRNPYPLETERDRPKAISFFEAYFQDKIENNDRAIINALMEIHHIGLRQGYVRLGCWCAPKACHGDVIKHFLDNNFDYLEELRIELQSKLDAKQNKNIEI